MTDDLPRLKWIRGGRGYKAYPAGTYERGREVELWRQVSGIDGTTQQYYENWAWAVRWEGWFAHSGIAVGKQAAADQATIEWWAAIQTELPREVELETSIIAARALVRPPPNSLFGEEPEFLRRVLWCLGQTYSAELKTDKVPAKAKELIHRLSEELYRRRLNGELVEPPVAPVPLMRRRRR